MSSSQDNVPNTDHGSSIIDPYYSSGKFLESSSGWLDAEFKVSQLRPLLKKHESDFEINLTSVADVGCGKGDTTLLLAEMLRELGYQSVVHGFDIHPDVESNENKDSVIFHYQDFCQTVVTDPYDLVVLFDVIEHVPDPISFLRSVANRTRLIALHIPLDDSLLSWMRDLPRKKLTHPGHLVVLDIPFALNLLTFSGLRIQDFVITPGFRAPSSTKGTAQKLLFPIRNLLYAISPYWLQRTFGGVSLMVIAQTPIGLQNKKHGKE